MCVRVETDMRATIDQLESAFKELQIMHSNLQDDFRKEETDRLVRLMMILILIS